MEECSGKVQHWWCINSTLHFKMNLNGNIIRQFIIPSGSPIANSALDTKKGHDLSN